MRNGANCLDSSVRHSYTSVQRVAGGGASAQPADCKEIRDEEKGQERRHEKGRKEKVAAGQPRLQRGRFAIPERPFLLVKDFITIPGWRDSLRARGKLAGRRSFCTGTVRASAGTSRHEFPKRLPGRFFALRRAVSNRARFPCARCF